MRIVLVCSSACATSRSGVGLGAHGGVVLADPRRAEAELVGPAQHLQIPLLPVIEAALGRMRRHGEEAEFHSFLPLRRPGPSVAASVSPATDCRQWPRRLVGASVALVGTQRRGGADEGIAEE